MGEFPARAGSIPVMWHSTIGSTNAEALALASNGERGPIFVAAERHSAGRGRRGPEWVSESGNLYATLLVTDPALPAMGPQLCFVAALALHDAVLDDCAGLAPARLQLKWPNDLLLDGKKVAGILIEGTEVKGGLTVVAIGFGVNCRRHPADTKFPATDFTEADFSSTPQTLLPRLGARWEQRVAEWNRGVGFAAIRDAWILRASGIGGPIEVRLPEQNLGGIFESINEQGALILRRKGGGREIISAGDVFPLNA